MEISNISGPDIVPGGFSVEAPINETVRENNNSTNYSQEQNVTEDIKGKNIDTYA